MQILVKLYVKKEFFSNLGVRKLISESKNQKFIEENQYWKNQIKDMLKKAQKNKNKNKQHVITALRHAARFSFLSGERILAVEIMKTTFKFLDSNTNQFNLALSDLHFYETGEKIYIKHYNFNVKPPSSSKSLKELSHLIIEL